MKEFNLELAKAGHPVQTRGGRKARIICWDAKSGPFPIIALINDHFGCEYIGTYTALGRYAPSTEDPEDLVMAIEKHEGWINLYKNVVGVVYPGQNLYETKEDAENAEHEKERVATIKIEWEEEL